jgi:hypothetical protein
VSSFYSKKKFELTSRGNKSLRNNHPRRRGLVEPDKRQILLTRRGPESWFQISNPFLDVIIEIKSLSFLNVVEINLKITGMKQFSRYFLCPKTTRRIRA